MLETRDCLGTSDESNLRFGSDSYAKGAWVLEALKNQETHQGNHGVCNSLLWPLVAVKFIEYPMAHKKHLVCPQNPSTLLICPQAKQRNRKQTNLNSVPGGCAFNISVDGRGACCHTKIWVFHVMAAKRGWFILIFWVATILFWKDGTSLGWQTLFSCLLCCCSLRSGCWYP